MLSKIINKFEENKKKKQEERDKIERERQEEMKKNEKKQQMRREEEERMRIVRLEREYEKKKKQEEDKLKKEREIKEVLEKNINEAYTYIGKSWINAFQGVYFLRQMLEMYEVKIEEENIYKTFLYVYDIGKDTNTIHEFDNIITEKRVDIITNILKYKPVNIEPYMLKMVVNSLNEYSDLILNESVSASLQVFSVLVENAKESPENISTHCSSAIMVLYLYIETLVKSLLLLNNKDKIINNTEFYKIQKNLWGSFKGNELEEKLYEMYIEFYLLTFDEMYSKHWLTALVTYINLGEEYMHCKLIDDLNEIISLQEKEEVEKGQNNINYDYIYYYMKKLVDLKLVDENNENVLEIYFHMIDEVRTNLEFKEIFFLLLNASRILPDINSYHKKKCLLEDKQRYIEGNFEKENGIKNQKLKLNLVYTGIQFEMYLKNIFEILEYEVETTKVTGDQGADLIITKNNIRTVVQAKFYSNTVGNKAVQEVVSAIKYYGADNGMVVTNNYYTNSARELAEANNITLWDKDILEKVISQL